MNTHGFTKEKIDSLIGEIDRALLNGPGIYTDPDENELLVYLRDLRAALHFMDPISIAMNDVYNEPVKHPKLISILTGPIHVLPLRINDELLTVRVIARWRLRNM